MRGDIGLHASRTIEGFRVDFIRCLCDATEHAFRRCRARVRVDYTLPGFATDVATSFAFVFNGAADHVA